MADRISELEVENERLRKAIRAAMDTMSVATDMQLGPGGVARKAYADLYVAYFTTPKMALATDEQQPTSAQVEQVRDIHQAKRAVRGPEPETGDPS